MENIIYCGLGQQKSPVSHEEGTTFMKTIHVELTDKRRYVGMLKILTISPPSQLSLSHA